MATVTANERELERFEPNKIFGKNTRKQTYRRLDLYDTENR